MSYKAKTVGYWFFFCVCLVLVALTACFWILSDLDQEKQRWLAGSSTVWGLNLCLMAAAAALCVLWRPLLKLLAPPLLWRALFLLGLGYVVCFLAPKTNRIYFDEHIYMQIGQNIAHTGRAECSDHAKVEHGSYHSVSGWVNKQPNGHPYLLSLAFRLFGVSPDVAHQVNRLHVGVAAAALFLALSLAPWGLPRGSAMAAALLFCFTPLIPWWGHTVAVEPAASSSTILAFLCACLFVRLCWERAYPETEAAAASLLGVSCAFACYFRPESALVYPLVFLVVLGTSFDALKRLPVWSGVLVSFLLVLPNVMHLWSMRTEDWGATDGRRFDTDFLWPNFVSNGGYFIDGVWFPVAGTFLLLAGLVYLFFIKRRVFWPLACWFLAAWGIFVFFYAGGYHYGASCRYAVISSGPAAVLMGIGLCALWQLSAGLRPLACFLSVLGLFNWTRAMHYVPGCSEESAEARSDVDWVERLAPTLPKDCLVVSNISCVWNVSGINAAQFYSTEPQIKGDLVSLKRQYPGGVYMHWDYWLNVTPPMAQERRRFIEEMGAKVEYQFTEDGHHFALLRLDTPEGLRRFGGGADPGVQRMNPADFKDIPLPEPATQPEAPAAAPSP